MNRRSFLQAILAAGVAPYLPRAEALMPLVRPKRFVAAGTTIFFNSTYQDLVESCQRNYIDSTTLLSTAKEYTLGLSTYTYQANTNLYLPEGLIFNPANLRADGEPVYPLELTVSPAERLVEVRGLSLGQYGNRIPEFTYVQPDRWEER